MVSDLRLKFNREPGAATKYQVSISFFWNPKEAMASYLLRGDAGKLDEWSGKSSFQ